MPIFKDGDIFKSTIPLTKNENDELFKYTNKDLKNKLYEFICSGQGVTRQEINEYMYKKFDGIDDVKKNNKIRTMITDLKNKDFIINIGSDRKSLWIKK